VDAFEVLLKCSLKTNFYITIMEQGKKFISPGAWFSIRYPENWNEFEDGEGSFLFYDPDVWSGNFRISAYKGDAKYGEDSVKRELRENKSASLVKVGHRECAYSEDTYEEDGETFTSYFWVIGIGNISVECSFTVREHDSYTVAEKIIETLDVRKEGMKYPAEIIPARLSEIYQINESFEWIAATVKEQLKKDFQGTEEDIVNMQMVVDSGAISPKKREAWLSLGIVLCVILCNEVDGLEWMSMIDGNREVPVLMNHTTGEWLDPMKLVWSKIKNGQPCNLTETYTDMGKSIL